MSSYGAMEAGEIEESGYSVMDPPTAAPQRNNRRLGVALVLALAAVAGAGVTAWSYGKDASATQLDAATAAPNSAGVGNENDAPAFGRAPAGTETSESPVGDQGSNPAYGTTDHIVADAPESNVADPNPYVPVEEDVEERATPGQTKKEKKEHNSDYDRGTPGKTEESPAGTTGSNPIDGMEGGEATSDPEMGSAEKTPTESLAAEGKIKAKKEKKQKEKMAEARNPKASGCKSDRCEEADHHQTPGNDDDAFEVPEGEALVGTKRVASKKGEDPTDVADEATSEVPTSNNAPPKPSSFRATPGETKKDHKEHNDNYDRGTPGKTEESPAGTTGSNPIDGMESGEAASDPEMGSAKNVPTEEDVEMVSKPNSSGVGQDPAARAPEGTTTGESAPGDEGSNPALSGGHQTPESDSPEANAEPAAPADP